MTVSIPSHHASSENVMMVLVASYIFTNEGNINRRIAQMTLMHAKDIHNLTLEEIAQQSGVSVSSYLRFCKGLGFSSYTQFRDRLSQCVVQYPYLGVNSVNYQEFFDNSNYFPTVRQHLNRDLDVLEETLNMEDCIRIVDAFKKADKIFFLDVLYSTNRFPLYGDLAISGKCIYYYAPGETLDAQFFKKIGPDSLIYLFYEGSNRDKIMSSVAAEAKKRGAVVAALSRYPNFPYRKYCDVCLYIGPASDTISAVTSYDLVLRYLSVLYRERCLNY